MEKNKIFTYIATLVILLGFLSSTFILWERHKAESSFKNLEIIISADDISFLAQANDKDLKETIKDFTQAGMTTVLFRERSLGDLERAGDLEVINTGKGVAFDILNPAWAQQLEESLLSKKIARIIDYQGKKLLEIPVKSGGAYTSEDGWAAIMDKTGVGFNHELLEIYKETNLMALPQIRSWKNYSGQSIDFIAEELSRLPEISIILSNDSEVAAYPDDITELLEKINPDRNAAAGMVEFFNQSGLNSFVAANDMQAVRVHSISDKEMLKFTEEKARDRYLLAAEERNVRALYLKFFNLDNPMMVYDDNLAYVTRISQTMEAAGFTLGKASIIELDKANKFFYGIIFLTLPAALFLIFNSLMTPIFGLIISGLLLIFLFLLALMRFTLALKTAGFILVVLFPILAFTALISYGDENRGLGLFISLKNTIAISLISLAGGLMMASLLSWTPFMIKTDQFAGVKLSHLLPLVLIPFLLILWKKEGPRKVIDLLNKAIEYKIALIGGIGALALGYYLLRTGNDGAGLVLGIEEKFRAALNQYLGVRPRTKELLIGYPSLVLLLYLGVNKRSWILLFPAIIGQISIANTYAHLHTPIAVSLQRTALGLIFGLLLAIILVMVWKILEKIYGKISEKYFN